MSDNVVTQTLNAKDDQGNDKYTPAEIRSYLGKTKTSEQVDSLMIEGYQPRMDAAISAGFTQAEVREGAVKRGIVSSIDVFGGQDLPSSSDITEEEYLEKPVIESLRTESLYAEGVRITDENRDKITQTPQTVSQIYSNSKDYHKRYSLNQFLSVMSKDAENRMALDAKVVKEAIIGDMHKLGVASARVNPEGIITYINNEGEEVPAEESMFQEFALVAPEIASGLVGGVAGAKACAVSANPLIISACALGGAGAGVFSQTAGADLLNSYFLDKKFELKHTINRAMNFATADMLNTMLGGVAVKSLTEAVRFTKGFTGAFKNFYSKNWGTTREILENLGMRYEDAIEATREFARTKGIHVSQSTTEEQMVDMFVNTTRRAEGFIGAAAKELPKTGKALNRLDAKSDEIIRRAAQTTSSNIGEVVPDTLRKYERVTKDAYGTMEKTGVSAVAKTEQELGEVVRFDPKVIGEDVFNAIEKNIANTDSLEEFLRLKDRFITAKGTKETREALASTLETAKTTTRAQVIVGKTRGEKLVKDIASNEALIKKANTGVKNALRAAKSNKTDAGRLKAAERAEKLKAEIKGYKTEIKNLRTTERVVKSEEAVQKAGQAEQFADTKMQLKELGVTEDVSTKRGFQDLLDARKFVNSFRYSNRFKGAIAPHKKALQRTVDNIDKEIEATALKFMPDGAAWYKQFKLENAAYREMKKVQDITLYKTLTKEGVDPNEVVKSAYKSAPLTDDVLMRVKEKLHQTRPSVARALDGALLDHAVSTRTKDKVIDFVALNKDLKRIPLVDRDSRQLKLAISELSKIEKNNPYTKQALRASQAQIQGEALRGMLGTSLIGKFDQEITAITYNKLHSRVYFTEARRVRRLVDAVSKVIDEPLNALAQKRVLDMTRQDTELATAIRRKQFAYAKRGEEGAYLKPKMWSVSSTGVNKAVQTRYGKMLKYYPSRTAAQNVAKRQGMKITEERVLQSELVDEQQAMTLLGRELTAKELKSAGVHRELKKHNIRGITRDKRVYLFKE